MTRPRRQAADLARRLERLGAKVILAPLIKTVPPVSRKALDSCLARLSDYDAVVFTSANAAAAVRGPRPRRVFAVGSATAAALSARGWRPRPLPESFHAAALARGMGRVRGWKVLFPSAEKARETLPALLRRAGARVDRPVAYRTVPDPAGRAALKKRAHWVTFMSPSAVEAFFAAGGSLADSRAASIGPVTSAALRARGVEPAAEAEPATAEGLARAIARRSEPAAPSALRAVLVRALRAGGREMRRGFLKAKVSFKGRANPVTEADLAAERAIIGAIRARFPDHGLLAEESGTRRTASDYVWVIDPIDGTLNFAHGFPHSCVSIAAVRRGEAVAAGIYDPFRDELFLAEKGKGATLNGKPIKVSRAARLEDSLLITGFAYDRHKKAALYAGVVKDFLERAADLRRSGSAALDLAWVAAGRLDGFWEFHLSPWDVAAGRLLVAEAGGKVSDFDGKPWGAPETWGRRTLASNGRIHAAMSRVLRGR